jgi:hypothetical protein
MLKTRGRLIKQAPHWLWLADSHLMRRLFGRELPAMTIEQRHDRHYLNLGSAVLGLTLFRVGYLVDVLAERHV